MANMSDSSASVVASSKSSKKWAPKTVAYGSNGPQVDVGGFSSVDTREKINPRKQAAADCLFKLKDAVAKDEIGFTPKEAIAMLEKTQIQDMRHNLASPFNDAGEYCPPPVEPFYRLNINDLYVLAETVPFSTQFMVSAFEHPDIYLKWTELGGVDEIHPSMHETYGKSLMTQSFEEMDGPARMNFYSHTVYDVLERIGSLQEQHFGKNVFKEGQKVFAEKLQAFEQLGLEDTGTYDVTTSEGIIQRLMDHDDVVCSYRKEVEAINEYSANVNIPSSSRLSNSKSYAHSISMNFNENIRTKTAHKILVGNTDEIQERLIQRLSENGFESSNFSLIITDSYFVDNNGKRNYHMDFSDELENDDGKRSFDIMFANCGNCPVDMVQTYFNEIMIDVLKSELSLSNQRLKNPWDIYGVIDSLEYSDNSVCDVSESEFHVAAKQKFLHMEEFQNYTKSATGGHLLYEDRITGLDKSVSDKHASRVASLNDKFGDIVSKSNQFANGGHDGLS